MKVSSKQIFNFFWLIVLIVFFSFALIFRSNASISGIKIGLEFCSEILIPSVFPFLVLSSFVVKSGFSFKIRKILEPFTRLFFNLPGTCGATIFIGLFGGYPTGARGIKALLDKREINEDQARKMIYFVVGAGPAFVISVVGTSLLKSFQAGITLFICQFLASLIIGILINLKKEEKKYKNINTKIREFPENIAISKAFVDSCTDATHAMINMCSLVVIFCSIFLILKTTYINSVIYTLIRNFGASETISESFLPAILEVTNGCKTACCLGVPYIFLAFIIGFSGLCVHFQIFSSVSDIAFSKIKFIFFRILHGFFSAILTEIAFSIWPASVEASLNIVHNNQTFNTYWVTSSSLSLIFLSACFLLTLSPKIIEIRDKNKNKCTKKELEKL